MNILETALSKVLLIAAIALLTWSAQAETLEDYLFSDDAHLRNALRSELPGAPTLHWVQEPELRISPELDVTDAWTETYSLRFRPMGRKARQKERDIFTNETQAVSVDWNKRLSSTLAGRYHQTIDLAERETKIVLVRQRIAIDRSLLTAQQSLSASTNFNAARLQSDALRLTTKERELGHLAAALEQLREATVFDYLAVSDPTRPAISSRLITPERIAAMLDAVTGAAGSNAFDNQLAQLAVQHARHEMALEKRQSGFGLSLMELSYENKGVDSYNVTLGFRLPFTKRSHAHQRRVRDVVAAEHHAQLASSLVSDRVETAARELRWRLDEYRGHVSALETLQSRMTVSDMSIHGALRLHQLALLERTAETHAQMLRNFVDLAHLTGALHQTPLRNWITGD